MGLESTRSDSTGLLLISSVVFGTCATLLRKLAAGKIHPFQFEAITGTTHAIIGWVCLYYAVSNNLVGEPRGLGMLWAMLQAIFSCAMGISFMYMLRAGAEVGYSSTISSTAMTALTILGSRFILGEVLTPRMLLGAIIMIVGVAIATFK